MSSPNLVPFKIIIKTFVIPLQTFYEFDKTDFKDLRKPCLLLYQYM